MYKDSYALSRVATMARIAAASGANEDRLCLYRDGMKCGEPRDQPFQFLTMGRAALPSPLVR